jgi:hypothetical protein
MSYNEIKEKPLALVNHYFLPTLLIVAILFALAIISNHPEVGEPRETVTVSIM